MWIGMAKVLVILCVLVGAQGYYWAHSNSSPTSISVDNEPQNRSKHPSNADSPYKYVYKHIQIGSANIPYGGLQPIPLVQPNRSVEYIASVDTTVIQPSPMPTNSRYQSWRRPKTVYVTRSGASKRNTCFKCPSEQILIAEKGTDGVLIDYLPAVTNCHNSILPQFKFQPLVTVDSPFLLPHGSHSFLAKIVGTQSSQAEQLCTLKYRVMVHRCPSYSPQNKGLRMKCSLDNLWGSSCSFTCKDGGYMNRATNVFCNDHLEWSGEEPYCHYQIERDNEIPLSNSCELPLPPKHGKFTCDTKTRRLGNGAFSERLPEGSMCRIKCNRHFELPVHLEKYSRFSCSNGHWNSTMMEFCSRVRRKNGNHL